MSTEKQTSTFSHVLETGKSLFDDIRRDLKNGTLFNPGTCFYCGRPILGAYYKDLYDRRICTSHTPRQCISCASFCDEGAVTIAEGKYLCGNCQHYHTTLKDAKEMVKMIRAHYLQNGLGKIERFHLELISLDDLRSLYPQGGGGDLLGLAIWSGRRYDIRVLRNLSHTAMAGVLAHEILHIWQYQRNLKAPLRICEGFCDLGSYEIYSQIKTKHAEVKINMLHDDPSPIYGDGYRIVKRYFDKAGWAGVIKKMEGYR